MKSKQSNPEMQSSQVSLDAITGEAQKDFCIALTDAFPSIDDLRRFIRFEIDENLDAIVGAGDLDAVIFRLTEHMKSHGMLKKLLVAALKTRPGNTKLRAFAERCGEPLPMVVTATRSSSKVTKAKLNAQKKQEISHVPVKVSVKSKRRVALIMALISGGVALTFYTWATGSSPPMGGTPVLAAQALKSQLSAIGGIIFGILINTKVREPSLTFVLASTGLILGAALPWLYQIVPSTSAIHDLTIQCHDLVGPAMFGFGVAFLVKAAEERGDATLS
jgi:Effector-associated domain 1